MPKHRVLIADDHSIILEGVRSLLDRDDRFEIVGEADNGRDVVLLAEARQPDIILLDLSMPHAQGTEVIAMLKRKLPETPIVIHTAHKSPQMIYECLAAGVRGYLVKGDEHANLLTALAAVIDGNAYLSPSICETLIECYLSVVRPAPSD